MGFDGEIRVEKRTSGEIADASSAWSLGPFPSKEERVVLMVFRVELHVCVCWAFTMG